MDFNRWDNSEKRSLCFRMFERDHSRLNNIYWYMISEKEYFDYKYREAKKNGNITSHNILNLIPNSPNAHKIHEDIEIWNSNRKETSKWVKYNSLLSLYSYFELYLNRISITAQESDPGIFLGTSKIIDGVSILKDNDWKKAKIIDYSSEITKGTWYQRLKNIETIFSVELLYSNSKKEDLEKTRNLRNSIAHYFGRDLINKDINDYSKQKDISFNEEKVLGAFELIYKVAEEIDKQLLGYIGEYEIIKFYHNHVRKKESILAKDLKKIINSEGKWSLKGKEYCQQLIDYYRAM